MKKLLILFVLCGIFIVGKAQNNITSTPLELGEKLSFYSNTLHEQRTLNIYLPPDYTENDSVHFPVIYLLDGGMEEDFLHVVGLCQFFTMMYTMPSCIIVGISNVDRRRDFTFPTTVEEQKRSYPTTGGSANFIQFIEKELQPMIETKYNCSAEKHLIGQSLGGLLATEILLKKPRLFNHYFITSPSLWWDNGSLITNYVLTGLNPSTYIFISVGREGNMMVTYAKKLHSWLKKYDDDASLYYTYLPKEDHATILHNSLYQSFLKLYKPRY